MNHPYFVCIPTNVRRTVLYTGATRNLKRRTYEHRKKLVQGFPKRYNYEAFSEIRLAIAREEQIKAGSGQKKLDILQGMNPEGRDLYDSI
jgi:putative endonuclease